jgi:hypothetical protein
MDEFDTKIRAFVKDILNEKVKQVIKDKLTKEIDRKVFIASLYEIALIEYKGELLANREKINYTTFQTLQEL